MWKRRKFTPFTKVRTKKNGKFVSGKAKVEMSEKGIDFDAILEQVKDGADVGVLAEVQDGKDHVFISIE